MQTDRPSWITWTRHDPSPCLRRVRWRPQCHHAEPLAHAGLFGCQTPFHCIKVESVPVPEPAEGQVLLAVKGSSVNPCDVDYIEFGVGCSGGGGVLGMDVAGTVVKVLRLHRARYADHSACALALVPRVSGCRRACVRGHVAGGTGLHAP